MEVAVEVWRGGTLVDRREVAQYLRIGREVVGVNIDDPRVSRQHLLFSWNDGVLQVTDLNSENGTWLNGTRITGRTTVTPGDVITIGRTEIRIVVAKAEPHGSARPAAIADLEVLSTNAADIRYRPGSPGERAARPLAAAVQRARKSLAGLGSEPWGVKPQVCLVDPFPDPNQPDQLLTQGSVIDAERGEIWMVVTAESPPDPPERPLALLFGAELPAGAELAELLEGYGLYVAGVPDPDPRLRPLDLPALSDADGDLGAAMSLSFVSFLVQREGRSQFLKLLATARPGKIEPAAHDIYGMGMTALEEAWRQKLRQGPPQLKATKFLSLAAGYLRPHVRREIEISFYMLIGLAFTMLFPFVTRQLFDKALPSGQFSQVFTLLVLLGAALAISLLAGLRRAYLSAYVSGAITREIRSRMFARLQGLSPGWFNQHQQGDILSRLFNDVAVLESGLSQTLREGAFQVLNLVVAAIILVFLSPILGAIVLIGAPLVAIVYKGMSKGAQQRSIATQEESSGLYSVSSENYQAQPVVKAFSLEALERSRFWRASERLFRAERRLALYGGLFSLSVNSIVTLLRLVVLGLGAWLILHGNLTIGGLVAFMGLMGEVLGPITGLTNLGQQIQASSGALIRVNQVLEEEPEIATRSDAPRLSPLSRDIRLEKVSFSYSPERLTLEDVDAVIQAGTRVAFVGPSGAGKSTVLQLLMRLADPDSGAVLFDGHNIRDAALDSIRAQLGVVFQETFLFDTTVRENISMGKPGASQEEIEEAARAAELHDYIVELPRGYDTLVGERGGRLSGGQRQRLSIARALIRNPAILLLDEATSALDPRTERLIADTLSRVGKGRTTISVTHRLTSITDYDRIFVIVAGRLVEQGRHEELLRMQGTYAELWAEQIGGAITAEAGFDAKDALSRLALFAQLPADQLEGLASRMEVVDLAAGERINEADQRLCFVRRGRARVLTPSLGGDLVASAELGSGDAFGLAAALGQATGSVLEAVTAVSLLILKQSAFADIRRTFLAVSQPAGERRPELAPARARRLSRLTLGRPQLHEVQVGSGPAPTSQDVRRASGAMPLLR